MRPSARPKNGRAGALAARHQTRHAHAGAVPLQLHMSRARAAVLAWRARGVHSMVAGWPAPLHAWPLPGDPVPYRQAADQSRSRRREGGPGRPQAGTGGDVRAQGLAGRPTGRGLR